jgi:hypothetical protein
MIPVEKLDVFYLKGFDFFTDKNADFIAKNSEQFPDQSYDDDLHDEYDDGNKDADYKAVLQTKADYLIIQRRNIKHRKLLKNAGGHS